MLAPPFLTPGDKIGIVSTARKIDREALIPAIKLIDDWGFRVKLGKSIDVEYDQFAGDDLHRASDFQQMLDDSEIKAIWCARGGYGTVRMVDKLDFESFKKNPKWIIGYSDITVLHAHVHGFGISTLHAQMPLEIEKKTPETAASIQNALLGHPMELFFSSENRLNRPGRSTGPLIGGNLSVLYSLCGSASAIDTTGKILFLEDLDEYLYHIDRMLQNLKRNGMLDNLSGLVVGGMTDMNDNTIPFGKTAEEIIGDAVSEYGYPVAFNCPAGHLPDNRALIFGSVAELEINESRTRISFRVS